jgi:hypothetical protein
MMRLACCALTEAGIKVCGPIHDAVLLEAPIGEIDHVVAISRAIMERASERVLRGFRIRVDASIYRHPDRYHDEDGWPFWERVLRLAGLAELPCGT